MAEALAPDVPPVPRPGERQPLARRPLLGVLAVLGAVECWAAAGPGRYGYHRDELYFLAAGRRPAWGYPDQPPLTPMIARLTELVHAHSPFALRVPAILAVLWVTWTAAQLAREFGGAAFAQLLAALAVGSGLFVLMSGHLLATSTPDLAVWVTLTWLLVRILRTGSRRSWLGFGAVLAVGLLNKQLPVLLAVALVAGILAVPAARPVLRGPWPWAALALALLAWTPVLVWQARHGWPQATLAGQIRAEYGTPAERANFVATQFALFSPGATVLWVIGTVRLFREARWERFRPIAWGWVALMAIIVVTAGQVYYAGGIYPALIAAGAVAVEGWRPRVPVALGTVGSALLMLPAGLPVLPPATLDRTFWGTVGEPLRESVGWPELVAQTAAAYRTLPPDRRATAVLMTSNYGEAGALEELGPRVGLPSVAYSGHNGFGDWGPPPEGAAPVVLIWQRDPGTEFTGCRPFGPVVTGVRNEEGSFAGIFVCDGPVGGWHAAWPRLRHLAA